ncbi:aldo/keto reductase [Hoyosella altamirensis]|uniref:Diketogulonate reductase-like aldo/keto reductase n=1 Tax=Hoyosella altamirensis TaxID=616997 RepID=A0A839RSZ0_9ACTN|nr:aldo/keto reductase [Hoyosella altamirensis]MBB3039467.1 diketogulonate reductase-like aldo/keto reductase [Hoyosella altamirensis]
MAVPQIALMNGTREPMTIPQLGLGTARMSDEDTQQLVRVAFDVGYRSIDTAASYENEVGVGRGFRDSGLAREQAFISTKLRGSEQGFDSAKKALDASLDRLGVDYVDLYLIHWPLPRLGKYIESWNAMEELLAEGKTRAIGVSNFMAEHLERLAQNSSTVPAVNQIELHPREPQRLQRADDAARGIVTEAWSPLGNAGDLLQEPALRKIAEKYQKSPVQVVLRWHMQQGIVTFPKASTRARLEQNLEVFDFELGPDDLAAISSLENGWRVNGQDPRHYEEF